MSRQAEVRANSRLAAYLSASAQPPLFPAGGAAAAEGKRYRGGPRLSLPPPRAQPRMATRCDPQGLSDLLFYSFGVSRLQFSAPARDRTAPGLRRPVGSGGALFPTQLYVLHQGIGGMPDGLSHFDPLHHQLEVLLYGALAAPGLRPAEADEPPRVTLLLTSASWNTVPKYQHFGYRLITLEFGMVAEQLGMVAAALGARCTLSPVWPSAFRELLQPTDDELPGPSVSVEWPGSEAGLSREEGWTRTEAVSRPTPVSGLTSCPVAWQLEQAARAGPPNPGSPEHLQALTPVSASTEPSAVFDIFRARRSSVEGFQSTPISGTVLQAVLGEVVSGRWGQDVPDLLVVTRAVTGVGPGIYRFDPAGRTLVPVQTSDPALLLRGGTPGNVDQSTHPAAWLYPVVKLDCDSPGGAGQYRDAQIRVGRLLQRLHLAYTAHGIDGHISLAYDVQAVQHVLGLDEDRYPAAQLLLGRARPVTECLNLDLRL